MDHGEKGLSTHKFGVKFLIGLLAAGTILIYLLWAEHKAHIIGALPYIILGLCPLIHIFMHGGHNHSSHKENGQANHHPSYGENPETGGKS